MLKSGRGFSVRQCIIFVFLIIVPVLLSGCFGGGGPVAPGSIDGYVFKPENRAPGSIKVAPTPKPPEGYVPCKDALVKVIGSTNTARTDEKGYFRIDGISPGYQTVTITYSSYTLNVKVKVLSGQLVSVNPVTGSILPKKWTIMVYMCADNNLEAAGIHDVNEMEQLGSNDDVNILLQIDRAAGYDSSNGDWKGARRYYIRPDGDTAIINSPVVYWFGAPNTDNEIDMGDPNQLREFVSWATANYPAQHYMLVLWNHGNGWTIWRSPRTVPRAVCFDDTGTQLDIDQIRVALSGLPHLDIIGMDACLMQMIEVAYEFKGLADIMVSSEESEPGDGWEYQNALADLHNNPDISAWEVAKDIVDTYWERHKDATTPATQSAFRLSYADDVAYAIKNLKDTLLSYVNAPYWNTIRQQMIDATGDITCYGQDGGYSFYDIRGYAEALKQRIKAAVPDPAKSAISGACDNVMNQINSTSVYSKGNGYGLSIYIPVGMGSPNYDWLLFDKDIKWSEIFQYYQ